MSIIHFDAGHGPISWSDPTGVAIGPLLTELIRHLYRSGPEDQRELSDWADHVHASARTLSRLFPAETGLSFAAWRTQVHIRAAIQLLGTGTAVNATARAVGYGRPSAFISAFRRVTGHTPGPYMAGYTQII